MKLPNGYGTVYKLSGKRRNPYIVRKTVGWSETGKQLYATVGYYPTKEEGLQALSSVYNKSGIDIVKKKRYTLSDVYQQWLETYYSDKKEYPAYKASWQKMIPLYNKDIATLNTESLQQIVDQYTSTPSAMAYIKVLFNKIFTYAMQRDIVQKNYATYIVLPKAKKSTIHKPFTPEELKTLWQNKDNQVVASVLCMIYLGTRPSEFLGITKDKVHLKEHYLIGGMKTAAGKDRVIPIPKIVEHLMETFYNTGNTYLFEIRNKKVEYNSYQVFWERAIKVDLQMDHLPHDCRHTCATMLDLSNVPPNIIRRILGHAGAGVTEQVYTHKSTQVLIDAVYNLDWKLC